MSTDDTSAPAETPTTTESNEPTSTRTPRVGLHSMLTRDSDMAGRPGFRNPSNKRSKALAKKSQRPKVKKNRKKKRK